MHHCQEGTHTCTQKKISCMVMSISVLEPCCFWYILFQQKRELLLEFDITFIQEVDIKEPSEEQIQTTKRIKYEKDILLKSKALHSSFYNNRGHIVYVYAVSLCIYCVCTWSDQVRAGWWPWRPAEKSICALLPGSHQIWHKTNDKGMWEYCCAMHT